MSSTHVENTHAALSGAQVVIETLFAVLALGSIALLSLRLMSGVAPEIHELALMIDYVVCLLFISKAAWDLWRAPNKREWLRWGWADILASVPEIEAFRAFRLLRLLLIVRVLRSTTRSARSIATYFNAGRTQAVLATVFALIVVSIVMSSFLVLGAEAGEPLATIKTAGDALLWTTTALFGAEPSYFGDLRPVTVGGQMIAIWLMILSLGLIGSLAGVISAWIEDEPPSPQAAASGNISRSPNLAPKVHDVQYPDERSSAVERQ